MKVLFKGRMLPKQFDTSRDAGRMYLIILRIKSNQINLALRVRSLITGLSTCLLQQHSLALPSWHLIALTFTRWLTTPEGSYEANAGFHWYVSSIRFHWGGDLLQRFIFTVNLWTSAGAQPVEGDGMTPCPFPIQGRIPWGGGREQHLSGEAFTVEDTEGAPCRLLWLWVSDVASYWLLPLCRGRAPAAREHWLFSKAAVLLMSPQTKRTAPICSKYISLSS